MRETIILGGGCFWCLEAVYREIDGIQSVESGYAGGKLTNPTYKHVSMGNTGYAEVVKLIYNSELISFEKILEIFFVIHDPTKLNQQDNDIGTQYRSVIYYNSLLQLEIAKNIISQMKIRFTLPIVTELSPLSTYYKAEDNQQNYFQRYPFSSYCIYVIAPKLVKFRNSILIK